MPSEQATAAALEIEAEILARRLFDDHTQESIAAIIDAAFAPVVSLLREAREIQRLTFRMEHTRDAGEYDKADESIKAIHARIDALMGKEES